MCAKRFIITFSRPDEYLRDTTHARQSLHYFVKSRLMFDEYWSFQSDERRKFAKEMDKVEIDEVISRHKQSWDNMTHLWKVEIKEIEE